MKTSDVFVSVIIPARNASASLPECLLSLRVQSFPKDRFEVIVVDDGSTDNTAAVAEKFWAQVITIAPSGPAVARNRGAEKARGDLLLFTDADCAPAPDWISQMVLAFEDPDVVAAKGIYRTQQSSWTARFVQAEYQSRYRIMRQRKTIDFVDTYSAAYRKSDFDAAGGFDESFPLPSVEDQEFSFRLAAKGAKMVFRPEAMVGHQHVDNPIAYFRKKMKIGYWKMKVLARFPKKIIKDSHTPVALKVEIASMAAAIASIPVALVTGLTWLPFYFLGLFFLWGAPFYKVLLPGKPGLALRAPFFLVARSLALLAGMTHGLCGKPIRTRAVEKRADDVRQPETTESEREPERVEQDA